MPPNPYYIFDPDNINSTFWERFACNQHIIFVDDIDSGFKDIKARGGVLIFVRHEDWEAWKAKYASSDLPVTSSYLFDMRELLEIGLKSCRLYHSWHVLPNIVTFGDKDNITLSNVKIIQTAKKLPDISIVNLGGIIHCNCLILDGADLEIRLGRDAECIIDDSVTFQGKVKLFIEQGAKVNIGEKSVFRSGTIIHVRECGSLEIGRNGVFSGTHFQVFNKIKVGADCLFSWGCEVRDGDGHDVTIEERLNHPRSIDIGNKVWAGKGVLILKGTSIGDGCILSAGCIVTNSFDDAVLVAGVPAIVRKGDVSWDIEYTAFQNLLENKK